MHSFMTVRLSVIRLVMRQVEPIANTLNNTLRKRSLPYSLETLAPLKLDKATQHTSYGQSLVDIVYSDHKSAQKIRLRMYLRYLRNGIAARYDSPVDISLAAWAAVETSGGFPAVKAGIDMPAKKTDCFSGKRQFGFLSDSLKKYLTWPPNKLATLNKSICCSLYIFSVFAMIGQPWLSAS